MKLMAKQKKLKAKISRSPTGFPSSKLEIWLRQLFKVQFSTGKHLALCKCIF